MIAADFGHGAGFNYDLAFSRNLGWVTDWEQTTLRLKTVAIAGLGGVGGAHVVTLARLGIGAFHIADFDRFDLVNLNRQAGASRSTLGRPKVDVIAEMALGINPEARIERFPDGLTTENLDHFLDGVDVFVDGLDFFVMPIRRQVFAKCRELGIPALTAAPIGMGAGFLVFLPNGMSFEDYFLMEGQPETEQYLRFLLGVAPRGLHRAYVADPSRADIANKRGPSTSAACELCAGITAIAVLKLLLGRGGVRGAPWHMHFDAYLGRLAWTRLRWGNSGPLQRIKLAIGRRIYAGMARLPQATPSAAGSRDDLHAVLDVGRWTASGDNTQPWRFEVLGPDRVRIHLGTEAATNPYEFRGGEPTLLAGGMLLESLRLAASARQRRLTWTLEDAKDPYRILVDLPQASDMMEDPLYSWLPLRSVDRRPFRARRLSEAEKVALRRAIGPALTLDWHESLPERLRVARLGAGATAVRLRTPETFAVHKTVLDWTRRFSPTGIPVLSLGLDRATLAIMRWGMADWCRMERLNRWLGTGGVALQLDLLPGLASAAFFSIRADLPETGPSRIEALLSAGQALQRFWLTATQLGLAMQPALATLIFADHGARDTAFTQDAASRARARRLSARFVTVFGRPASDYIFLGRIGERFAALPRARSIRRPLEDLLIEP